MNKKTLIFDIDGTLTDLWPIERVVLARMLDIAQPQDLDQQRTFKRKSNNQIFLRYSGIRYRKQEFIQQYNRVFTQLKLAGMLPSPEIFPASTWVQQHAARFHYVYATGGQRPETLYVLEQLGILSCFDLTTSIDKMSCKYSKQTGIPFKRIAANFPDCIVVTDSRSDCQGAQRAGIRSLLLQPRQMDLSALDLLYTNR